MVTSRLCNPAQPSACCLVVLPAAMHLRLYPPHKQASMPFRVLHTPAVAVTGPSTAHSLPHDDGYVINSPSSLASYGSHSSIFKETPSARRTGRSSGWGGGGSGVPLSPSGSGALSGSPWARSSGPRRGMALQVRPTCGLGCVTSPAVFPQHQLLCIVHLMVHVVSRSSITCASAADQQEHTHPDTCCCPPCSSLPATRWRWRCWTTRRCRWGGGWGRARRAQCMRRATRTRLWLSRTHPA